LGPVHCPLCPAPLPPLVGGDGLANAGAVVVITRAPLARSAAILRFIFTSSVSWLPCLLV